MNYKSVSAYFPLFLVIFAFIVVGQIFMPFLVPLALAAAFATVLNPLFVIFKKFAAGSAILAATGVLLLAFLGILLPLIFMLIIVGGEAAKLYASVVDGSFAANVTGILQSIQQSLPVENLGKDYSSVIAENLSIYAREATVWISGHVTDAFSSISGMFLNFFIFFIAMFYFLKDGPAIKKSVIELSPLDDLHDRALFDHLGHAVNSVVLGNVLIILVRGIASAVGFFIFGVPNPLFWGVFAGILGLIPGIGLLLVFVPAIAYIYFISGWGAMLGLTLWGMAVVILIDNLFAPYFFGRGLEMHPLLVLVSILGGIAYFGPLGIFLGPLAISLFFALLTIYTTPSSGR